jgi:hypothetical protein
MKPTDLTEGERDELTEGGHPDYARGVSRRRARHCWMREQTHSVTSIIRYRLGSINPLIKGVLPMSCPTLSFDYSQEKVDALKAQLRTEGITMEANVGRLSDTHLPGSCPGLFTRRSPPRLFTAAARAGLRPAPESRSRGAYPHLLRSFTTRISFHLRLLPCFCSTHAVTALHPLQNTPGSHSTLSYSRSTTCCLPIALVSSANLS